MLSLKITDIKTFAEHLFVKDTFDKFHLHSAAFKTAFYTEIDGRRITEQTEGSEETAPEDDAVLWKDVRRAAFELIRGDRLPLFFRITLKASRSAGRYYKEKSGLQNAGITSLAINLNYQNDVLTLTTGVSYDGFTLDKSAEKLWDADVKGFLDKTGISFEDAFPE